MVYFFKNYDFVKNGKSLPPLLDFLRISLIFSQFSPFSFSIWSNAAKKDSLLEFPREKACNYFNLLKKLHTLE
jgi:hypothetical protein